jgi:uncharacterized repeat protein (TIGR03803 family)
MVLALFCAPAVAANFGVAHDFCSAANCADGTGPRGGLLFDSQGSLYGVTQQGGANSSGSIFRISADGHFSTLYDFCAQSCPGGNAPQAGLIADISGNLYGATPRGGNEGGGSIFMLSPDPKRARWKMRMLHGFCRGTPCVDGTEPASRLTYRGADTGLPYDGISPLYGTTALGGWNDAGIVFELTPANGGWKERVIYTFCSLSQCADGGAPLGLSMDGFGHLYVATHGGGAHNGGTVLTLSRAKKNKEWNAEVLYSFCARASCSDGSGPDTDLLRDAEGNLYGGTSFGGNASNAGVIFRLSYDGATWHQTVLHAFCSQRDCRDGAGAAGSLVMDAAGVLYGIAGDGDKHNRTGGALWRLDGADYTLLHSFCRHDDLCLKGQEPVAGLSIDASGRLFGETYSGGARNDGVVFELTP